MVLFKFIVGWLLSSKFKVQFFSILKKLLTVVFFNIRLDYCNYFPLFSIRPCLEDKNVKIMLVSLNKRYGVGCQINDLNQHFINHKNQQNLDKIAQYYQFIPAQLRYNLTMQQCLKIRKNRSLKEINCHSNQCSLANSGYQQAPKNISLKLSTKSVHLKPLLKVRNIPSHICKKIELKSSSLPVGIKNQYSNKYDSQTLNIPGYHGAKNNIKDNNIDKQNRPASMNELKHPSNSFGRHTFYSTQEIDNIKELRPIEKLKIDTNFEAEKKRENEIYNRLKLGKSSSRVGILKLRQKDQKIKTESQIGLTNFPQSPQFMPQKAFRKGIIQQIFNKVKIKQTIQTESVKSNRYESKKQNSLMESTIQQSEREQSPPLGQKIDKIFHADCSTIEEKQECNTSFISKKDYRELTKYLENFNPEKRKKIEKGKFRKKFPQNFFK